MDVMESLEIWWELNTPLVFLDGCMAVAGQSSRPGNLPTGGRRRTSDLELGSGVGDRSPRRVLSPDAPCLVMLQCSALLFCLDDALGVSG